MSQINLGYTDPTDVVQPAQNYVSLFSVNANQLGLKSPNGSITYLRGYPSFRLRAKVTLTVEMITNKQFSIEEVPEDLASILLIPLGGPPQDYGLDYVLTGNVLSWADLGLDGILTEGDTLSVYF